MVKNIISAKSDLRVCIITSPRPKAGITPLSNLTDVFCFLSNKVYLITGDEGGVVLKNNPNVQGYCLKYKLKGNIFFKIIEYIFYQLKVSYYILKLLRNVDIWILFMAESLLLPMIVLKLLRKKVILPLASSYSQIVRCNKSIPITFRILNCFENINHYLADIIVLYSQNLITDWHLEKFTHKIIIAPKHFLNLDIFSLRTNLNSRDIVIGFIGRFSEEKGVVNFVKAIPDLLKENTNLNILIAGSGHLQTYIEKELTELGLLSNVTLTEWIDHDDLPHFLNQLKLLVIPSYTEGLPNIMLEAMACGTPVLATRVGAIPDIIKDEKTGFIMENNSPECIAKNVSRALEHPDIENIAMNSKKFVETNFTYAKAVEKYSAIFEICKKC